MGKRVAETVTLTVPAETDLRHDRRVAPVKAGLIPRLMAASRVKDQSLVKRRRSVPIAAYVGPNGSGKTAAMVHDTIPSLDAGRTVFSTMPLYDSATGLPHDNYVPFVDWEQLLHAESADILMDEIVAVASSRESASMHVEVQRKLNQLRKNDVVLRWSAPSWKRADVMIREVTVAVTECRGMFTAKPVPDPVTGEFPLWSPRQLFRLRTFDMMDFDEWTAGKREKLRPMVRQWWLGPGSRAFDTYRTLDPVNTIPPYEPDKCPVCNLKQARQTCRGHDGASRPGRRHAS